MKLRTMTPGLLLLCLAMASPATAGIPENTLRDILLHEQARDAGDGVLRDLAVDKKAEVRARALRALGRIQDPALLEVFTAALADKDPSVRFEATFALGQMFDPAAEPVLLEAFDREKDPEIRGRMVEALGKCGTESTVPHLAEILSGSDAALAGEAALALGTMGSRGIPVSAGAGALRNGLVHENPEVRWRSAFAVQRGKVSGASAGLRRSLRQSDAYTLMYSAKATIALNVESLAEFLVPLFGHEDWRVRVEGLRAMGALKKSYYTGQASILLEDPNEHVRLTAIATMGDLTSGGGLGRIELLEQSSDWRIRAAVIKAEIAGSGDGSVQQVRDAIKDADWRIRAAAAEGLGALGSPQSLLLLESLANDEAPQVAAAVVNGLSTCEQKHAVEMIRGYLGHGDPLVVAAAAHAAGERHDYYAITPLLAAYSPLQSPVDTEVMTEILGALGSILTAVPEDDPVGTLAMEDSSAVLATLERALSDPDANVAKAAAASLSRITGTTVAPRTHANPGAPAEFDADLAVQVASGKKNPRAILETSRGQVVIELLGQEAPGTVANFVTLARRGYYNGLTFHRVIADFVVQGGDPRGTGMGGPGYAIRCEYNPLRYDAGMVGMALAGKDTGGSQFFITHSPQPHLNGKYTIFGKVLSGMDVVDTIQVGDLIEEVRLEGI